MAGTSPHRMRRSPEPGIVPAIIFETGRSRLQAWRIKHIHDASGFCSQLRDLRSDIPSLNTTCSRTSTAERAPSCLRRSANLDVFLIRCSPFANKVLACLKLFSAGVMVPISSSRSGRFHLMAARLAPRAPQNEMLTIGGAAS